MHTLLVGGLFVDDICAEANQSSKTLCKEFLWVM
jgi:hypothetical protein